MIKATQILPIGILLSTLCIRAHADIINCANTYEEEALQAVVSIVLSPNNKASGVIVGHNQVLTVAHALPLNAPINVKLDTEHPATVIAVHEGYDLALLSTDTEGRKPIVISHANMDQLQTVWSVGFNDEQEKIVSTGQFLKSGYSGLVSTARVEPGQSGGALFQCNTEELGLSGILQSFVARYENGELVNKGESVSVPATIIRQFLASLQIELALAKLNK